MHGVIREVFYERKLQDYLFISFTNSAINYDYRIILITIILHIDFSLKLQFLILITFNFNLITI